MTGMVTLRARLMEALHWVVFLDRVTFLRVVGVNVSEFNMILMFVVKLPIVKLVALAFIVILAVEMLKAANEFVNGIWIWIVLLAAMVEMPRVFNLAERT